MDSINITLILAQLVNFLILFIIFKKFIADKLIMTIIARRELQARLERAAEDYEKSITQAEKQKKDILKQARRDAQAMMWDMETLAHKKSWDIILAAEHKANLALEAWRRQLQKERLSMLTQMKSKIIDLSLRLNEKLFEDKAIDREFMEKELKTIQIWD